MYGEIKFSVLNRSCPTRDCPGTASGATNTEVYCQFGHFVPNYSSWNRPACECGFDKMKELNLPQAGHSHFCAVDKWLRGQY